MKVVFDRDWRWDCCKLDVSVLGVPLRSAKAPSSSGRFVGNPTAVARLLKVVHCAEPNCRGFQYWRHAENHPMSQWLTVTDVQLYRCLWVQQEG